MTSFGISGTRSIDVDLGELSWWQEATCALDRAHPIAILFNEGRELITHRGASMGVANGKSNGWSIADGLEQ